MIAPSADSSQTLLYTHLWGFCFLFSLSSSLLPPIHLIYLVGPLSLSLSLGFCLQAVITWSSCGMWLVESQWCALTQCTPIWSTAPAGTETALRSLLPARTRNYECSTPARAPSSLCVHAFNVKKDNANQKRMHRGWISNVFALFTIHQNRHIHFITSSKLLSCGFRMHLLLYLKRLEVSWL